jgi:hypothetical protein
LQITEAKKEMHHYIGSLKKQKLLTTLYLTEKDQEQIVWENKTEFIYHHDLYDLVEKKQTKEGILITCLMDKNEEALIQTFNNYNDQSYPSHTSSSSLFKLINQSFLSTGNLTFNKVDNSKTLLTSQYIIHLPSQLRFVLIPPPKIVC